MRTVSNMLDRALMCSLNSQFQYASSGINMSLFIARRVARGATAASWRAHERAPIERGRGAASRADAAKRETCDGCARCACELITRGWARDLAYGSRAERRVRWSEKTLVGG